MSLKRAAALGAAFLTCVLFTNSGPAFADQVKPAKQSTSGVASWYGEFHHGRPTANGEIFDMYALTAAHPTLQLPSVVRVTNLANGRSLLVRVNDRGPFADDRLIAVSQAAARELGFEQEGATEVLVQYLGLAPFDEKPIRPGERREYVPRRCELATTDRLVC